MLPQILIAIIGLLHILNTSIRETFIDSENRILVREVSTPLAKIAESLASINKKLDFLVGYKSLDDGEKDSEPTPGEMNRGDYNDYVRSR